MCLGSGALVGGSWLAQNMCLGEDNYHLKTCFNFGWLLSGPIFCRTRGNQCCQILIVDGIARCPEICDDDDDDDDDDDLIDEWKNVKRPLHS